MSSQPAQEIRDFQQSQVDAAARAALATTEHLGRLADIYLQAGKELITTLQSHSQQVLSSKDLAALAQAHSALANSLLASGVKVSQDVLATHNQYAQQAREQVSAAVSEGTSKATQAAQAVQQSVAQSAQSLRSAQERTSK